MKKRKKPLQFYQMVAFPFSVCFWKSSHQYGPKSHEKSKKPKYMQNSVGQRKMAQWATNKANIQKHIY